MIHLTALAQLASTTAASTSKSSGSILDPIAKPLADVLAAVYSVIPNYGVAIMGLSVIWMLLIAPLTLKSTRSMLAMQKLQPEMKKLQAKHKDDKQALNQAMMELYREHGASPFGACLPMLLPMPVFIALFRVIDGLSHTTKMSGVVEYTPKYLSHGTAMYKAIVAGHGKLEAFGMDLSKTALAHHSGIAAAAPYWLAILIMGGTSYFQSAMMMSRNPANAANPQARMMKFIAPLFALICIRFPAGVILYYATSNICRIIQQDAMYRYDPKVKALVAQEVLEVEEIVEEIDEQEALRRSRPGYTPPRAKRSEDKGGKTPPGRSGQRGSPQARSESARSGGTGRDTPKAGFKELWNQAAAERRKQLEARNGSGSGSGTGSGRGRAGQGRQGGTSKGGGQSNRKRRGR